MGPEYLVAGRVYSFDAGARPYEGMLVRDGKVAALLDRILPFAGTVIELGERTACPAFVDSHVHVLELGLVSIFPDLSRAGSLTDVFDALSAARGRAREHRFLLAFNLEPDRLQERRMPSRQELDRVIPEQPVLVYRIDGHSAALNTSGLRRVFGADAPEGIELDAAREPTGLVASVGYEQASRVFKRMLPRELKTEAFLRAAQVSVEQGVLALGAFTGSDEPGDDIPELLLEFRSRLPLEVAVYPQTRSIARARQLGSTRVGGCILIDGSFGSHTAALNSDYADAPGNQGRLYLSDAELESYLREADTASMQTAVHAIGDRAVEQVVACYEHFLVGNPLRHRIEHAELLNRGLMARIARLGLVLGVQPAFEHYWGGPSRMYEQRLGSRYLHTNPYRDLLDAGVTLAGGSDAPITPVSPELGVRSAAERVVREHNLTRLEALRLFTDRAAFALGLESRKGSLRPGHDADFLILEASPLDAPDLRIARRFRAGQELR
jgi:predicted amidohydrolase YtcJ